jgi:hypothetical protein
MRFYRVLSNICFALGFVAIIVALIIWAAAKGMATPEDMAHGERFAIFVGLWAPTLWIFSNRLDRFADKAGS